LLLLLLMLLLLLKGTCLLWAEEDWKMVVDAFNVRVVRKSVGV